jgi:glycosyltransferase involved in cell wall biosynthesis
VKILGLAANYPPDHHGGYGLVAQAICEGLAARGHDVQVLTRGPASTNTTLTIHRSLLSIPKHAGPLSLLKATKHNIRVLNHIIDVYQPDLLLSCGNDGIGYCTYLAGITRCKSLTYLGDTWLAQAWRDLPAFDAYADFARGGRKPGFGAFLKRMMAKLMGPKIVPPKATPITVISKFVLDDLLSTGFPAPDNVSLTYIPLHRSFFNDQAEAIGPDGSTSSVFRTLFVSRVEKLKGPDLAIEAVARAVQGGIDATLTIAGLHIERMQAELSALAKSLKIEDRMRFAGTPALAELIALYRSHDCFLFPSRIVEGLGIVNCEAQACGLPIIGTAESGAAEVIRDGETGFRVPIGDAAAMGDRIMQLARDRELHLRMRATAMESARRFHPERILDVLEQAVLAAMN